MRPLHLCQLIDGDEFWNERLDLCRFGFHLDDHRRHRLHVRAHPQLYIN